MDCKEGTLLRCTNCGLALLKNAPTKEKAAKKYKKFYDTAKSERFYGILESIILIFRKFRVISVEKFAKKKGKILDIGFGRPIDLEIFQDHGWSSYGTNVVPHVIQVAKKKKLNAFLGEITDAPYSANYFDVITMWHVLEHLHKPELYIKKAHHLLKKGGLLIIEVPNMKSPVARFFGCNWFELDLPNHIYQFTPKALTLLLNNNGFKVEEVTFLSFEQSPFSISQSILNSLKFRRNVVFESMKKQKASPLVARLFPILLMIILLPFALVITGFLGIIRKGDVMRFYSSKK